MKDRGLRTEDGVKAASEAVRDAISGRKPKVAIVLPYTVWQGISATNKSRLELHMAAWIDRVRQDPMSYGSVPRSAPIAPVIESNASSMNARSWCVMVGSVVDGGRDVTLDEVVLAGDSDG